MNTMTRTWRVDEGTIVTAVSKDGGQSVTVAPAGTRTPVHLDSWALGDQFRPTIRSNVPPAIVDDVLAWLDRPSEP